MKWRSKMKNVLLSFLATCVFVFNLMAQTNFPKNLKTENTAFVDNNGRHVILNGVNLIDKDATTDFMTNFDPDTVFANMKKWGFNCLRLGVTWAHIEPQPGVYNASILSQIEEWVRKADSQNIMIVLDMHQDLYSAQYGADGAPEWACFSDGGKHRTLGFWSGAYFISGAVQNCFENFWQNKIVPSTGIGLQDHYANMWKYLVNHFKNFDNIIGYDLMNEPFNGKHARWMLQKMIYALDIQIAHRDCVYGYEYGEMLKNAYDHDKMHQILDEWIESDADNFTADVVLNLFANGANSTNIRDEFYNNKWKYPHFDAWNGSWFLTRNWWTLKQKRGEFGYWAATDDPNLYYVFDCYTDEEWKYKEFTDAMAAENKNFETTLLQDFYQKVANEIRTIDTESILFLEHTYFANLGMPTGIEPVKLANGAVDSLVAYAPHCYDPQCGMQRFTQAHDNRNRHIFETVAASGDSMNVPTWVGEWGAFYSVPAEKEEASIQSAKAVIEKIESHKMSSCYYAYYSHGNRYFHEIISRTYPMSVAGELIDYSNDFSSNSFSCSWNEKVSVNENTIFYLSNDSITVDNIQAQPAIDTSRINIVAYDGYSYLIISPSGNSIQQQITIDLNPSLSFFVNKSVRTRNLKSQQYELGNAYPNPFNPTTSIDFNIPEQSDVTLKIFDISGKLVDQVTYNSIKGYHKYQFNGSELSSGIYFYQLNAGGNRKIKRMTLVK